MNIFEKNKIYAKVVANSKIRQVLFGQIRFLNNPRASDKTVIIVLTVKLIVPDCYRRLNVDFQLTIQM